MSPPYDGLRETPQALHLARIALAPAERDTLLATLQGYFRAGGSVVDAGTLLFCHPNTVRNHLRRVERHTGKSLDDPAQSAELYVALAAFTRLPEPPQSDRPG